MKALLSILLLVSSINAGFFKEDEVQKRNSSESENERLCKMFTEKAEVYKKTMREDELAQKTLESYEKRVNLYCVKS